MLALFYRFGPLFGQGGICLTLFDCCAELARHGPTWQSAAAFVGGCGMFLQGCASLLRELRASYAAPGVETVTSPRFYAAILGSAWSVPPKADPAASAKRLAVLAAQLAAPGLAQVQIGLIGDELVAIGGDLQSLANSPTNH